MSTRTHTVTQDVHELQVTIEKHRLWLMGELGGEQQSDMSSQCQSPFPFGSEEIVNELIEGGMWHGDAEVLIDCFLGFNITFLEEENQTDIRDAIQRLSARWEASR